MFGWAVLSYQFVTNGIIAGLVGAVRSGRSRRRCRLRGATVITVMLFLAYELGYWFNHWLSHQVPLLWEFHKVHHNAEVLTPLTNFRVHPVYTWIFANILAFSAAVANGLGNYMFGETAYQYALADTNIILVLFIHAYVHLQHSHMWIAFTRRRRPHLRQPGASSGAPLDRPEAFQQEFRQLPRAVGLDVRHALCAGKEAREAHVRRRRPPDAHTIKGELVAPLFNAAGHLKPLWQKRPRIFRACRLRSASRPRSLRACLDGIAIPPRPRGRGRLGFSSAA